MKVYDLTPKCLERDYHGCGKAWAAIDDKDRVVALRYMDSHWIDFKDLPKWIRALRKAAKSQDSRGLPTAHSSAAYALLANAAQECSDCPIPPRKERYRPSELLQMARAALAQVDAEQFAKYRQKSRDEMARLGRVVSGMCSCTKFCV